jgi:hypothetical protein
LNKKLLLTISRQPLVKGKPAMFPDIAVLVLFVSDTECEHSLSDFYENTECSKNAAKRRNRSEWSHENTSARGNDAHNLL